MHIYFLRHGKADWPGWKKPDDERPLTRAGEKEAHQVAKLLVRLGVEPNVILTSPLPRAAGTAEITAQHLKCKCREDKLLAPGFDTLALTRLLRKHDDERLMIVGHEPDFTNTILALTGATLKLSKGGVALIEIDSSLRKGRLLWLFPPKFARC